jgi:hypothetical protein
VSFYAIKYELKKPKNLNVRNLNILMLLSSPITDRIGRREKQKNGRKTKKMNINKRFFCIGVIAAIAILTFAFAIAAAGSDGGVVEKNAEGVTVAASAVTSGINYQGRLTDSAGEPLSGTYTMTFRLYEVASGGSALDTDTHSVEVTDGLFNTEIDFDQEHFDGRGLWLGITVGGDAEMSPRQELRPVPYALSLKPGANIVGASSVALQAESTHTSGSGIRGDASATSGTNYGVVGASKSPDGYGGYFYNNEGGTGVYGKGTPGGYFTTDQGGTSWADRTAGVDVATTHDYSYGVQAHTAGDNSNAVSGSTSGGNSHGVSASTTGDNSNGVSAYTAGSNSNGVWAYSVKHYGVYGKGGKYGGYFTTDQAGTLGNHNAGVNATTAYDYSEGVRAHTSGYDSEGICARTSGAYSEGVLTFTSGYNSGGVGAYTDGDYSEGVLALTTGDYSGGVKVYTYGENSIGVYASSDNSEGIYADTGRSDHKYGVRTPDKMCAEEGYDTSCSDVAEYFPVAEEPEPGTVMVIGEDSKLQCSGTAYDTTVAGIVSTAPGVSLGTNETGNEGEKLIAVAGRVPCKVDATYAPIEPGDLLTTSDTPGHAMKATDPQIGTILGKALEPLDSGTDVIEVLVTLQ